MMKQMIISNLVIPNLVLVGNFINEAHAILLKSKFKNNEIKLC